MKIKEIEMENTKLNKAISNQQSVISQNNFLPLLFAIAFAYLTFGAITNVAGAIVPKIKETYNVSGSASSFLASVFFIAYGLTSVPFGVLINKAGTKVTLIVSSLITTVGVITFASVPGYFPNMASMFTCGIGITGLQVALNPLVKEISNPEKYSRNLTLFMVLFGVGSTIAPYIVTLMKSKGFEWNYTYWVFTFVSVLMLLSLALPKYPEEKRIQQSAISNQQSAISILLKDPLMMMYTLAIFLYVGVEVGVAYNISLFLEDVHRLSINPGEKAEAIKNAAVGNYWFGLLVGRLLGSFVLDKISTKKAIQIYISCAAASLALAVFSKNLTVVLWAFPLVGFFISIMFPSIYGLAINSYTKEYSSIISGILCTAIIGGAVIAPVIAKVSEITGSLNNPNWQIGMLIAFGCYAYIFSVGMWAKEQKSDVR